MQCVNYESKCMSLSAKMFGIELAILGMLLLKALKTRTYHNFISVFDFTTSTFHLV